jgi:hypothetical protein
MVRVSGADKVRLAVPSALPSCTEILVSIRESKRRIAIQTGSHDPRDCADLATEALVDVEVPHSIVSRRIVH